MYSTNVLLICFSSENSLMMKDFSLVITICTRALQLNRFVCSSEFKFKKTEFKQIKLNNKVVIKSKKRLHTS